MGAEDVGDNELTQSVLGTFRRSERRALSLASAVLRCNPSKGASTSNILVSGSDLRGVRNSLTSDSNWAQLQGRGTLRGEGEDHASQGSDLAPSQEVFNCSMYRAAGPCQ